uniref:Uncharacterized protein n=1 Tax=Arundo donax TaxID=35708 RepID=A0A0A9CKD7_ARUDO
MPLPLVLITVRTFKCCYGLVHLLSHLLEATLQ